MPDIVVAQDTFTDSDGVYLQDHTPDIGGSWQDIFGDPPSTGLHIDTNKLAWDGDNHIKYLDSPSIKNGTISLTVLNTFNPCPAIVGRINPDTFDWIILYKYFGTWRLSDGYDETLIDGDVEIGTVISMVMEDDVITAYFDDELKATLVTTHVLDAGFVGLKAAYDVV
jgi:hypothetical protein